MALAVNFGYQKEKAKTFLLICITAAFGATFVGMQAFEWSKLIAEGFDPGVTHSVRPNLARCFSW